VPEPHDLADFDRFDVYCAAHQDEFGGRFADGERIFGVLFTDHVDEHEASLRALLSHPELVVVRCADRPWRELEEANRRLARLLMGIPDHPDQRHPAVNGMGIGMADGQFTIMVMVDPERRDAVEEIVALVHPEPITIHLAGPMHRL
jgi:hypothetical protein